MTDPSLRRSRGFTLLELIIALVVVGILSAIALPAYQRYVQKAHRANARAALLQLAHWMERAATVQGSYPASTDVIPPAMLVVEGGRYDLSLNDATSTYFRFDAAPSGVQADDACGTFTLDSTGVRGAAGETEPSAAAIDCWTR